MKPYLTLPYLTLPYLTLPYLTLPFLTFCVAIGIVKNTLKNGREGHSAGKLNFHIMQLCVTFGGNC